MGMEGEFVMEDCTQVGKVGNLDIGDRDGARREGMLQHRVATYPGWSRQARNECSFVSLNITMWDLGTEIVTEAVAIT
jgi:hypothetical protein